MKLSLPNENNKAFDKQLRRHHNTVETFQLDNLTTN